MLGHLGSALNEQLRNDNINDKNPHLIRGTRSSHEPDNEKPNGCSELLPDKSAQQIKDSVLHSDIIIYDFEESSLDEIEFAYKLLNFSELQDEKVFILISSCQTWTKALKSCLEEPFTHKDQLLRRGHSSIEVLR